ncbi:MAG: tetratricopeptide repeat protein [Desulfobacterales bacterium]|nr:tetratricopeptide repeat protein [Desulfobacterales bacterium]
MPKFIITIDQKDASDVEVKFNNLLSHRFSKSGIDQITKAANADLWRNNDIRAAELGRELFSVLDGTGGRLRSEMDNACDKGEELELYLDLPPDLDGLPFELMFSQGFLVHDHGVHIFRMASDRGMHKNPSPGQRALRILFMACSPEGQAALNFEYEEELILRETEKLHLKLDVEDSGSLEGLKNMVRWEGGFDVVHISGHAGIDEKLGPVFYMEDEIGGEDKVAPKQLQAGLRGFFPRILFLSGCSTGKRAPGEDTPSFTEQMVSSGAGFVMGWARPVTDVGATRMAAHLFKYLALGKDIAESVSLARQDIRGVYDTWALFRVYSDASRAGPLIASGMGMPGEKHRKTVYRTLGNSRVRVLEQGFVGRRRQIQKSVKALRGVTEQKGLLITGAAGVGKSCLAGKLMERFREKKLVAVHGRLETGDLFQRLIELFEEYDVKSGLEVMHSDKPPEERLMALFREAFQELPVILYLDDFEQNLERVLSGQSDADDVFAADSEVLPLVRGLLRGLPWAGGKTSLIISSRYPFRLEHAGKDLPEEVLFPVSLSSMRDADLKKKVEKLEFIANSKNRELYLEAGKGNPRLLEWLDKIAAEEEKYDLTDLKIRIRGKQADYVAEYLFALMAGTEGGDFEIFLRRAAVYRRPVPGSAFAAFGTEAKLKRAAWLTLVEQETLADGELFQVHPMIREIEWEKLSAFDQKGAHDAALEWYRKEIEGAGNVPYQWLYESVYHALSAGRIRQACGYAVVLGRMMGNMQLYQEHTVVQQEVADHVTDEVITEAAREKDGNVAVLLNDLGQSYDMLGDYQKVIKWTEKALELDLKNFGDNHPNVAIRYNNLGGAYNSLGEYGKAIGYFERALDIIKENYGEQHPHVAGSYNNLGMTYDSLGEYGKAIGYYERALELDLKNFGDNHSDTAIDYNNLGMAYDSLGEYGKAIGYFERALDTDLKNFGDNHPKVAIRYNNLGGAYNSLGEYGKAIGYYERALGIGLKNFGDNHPQIAIYNNNLGEVYRALGEYGKAIGYYERALDIDLKNFGDNHPSKARGYNNLGMAYYNMGEYEKAVKHIEQALKIFIQFLGHEHPNTKGVQNNLEYAKKALANSA